MKPGAILGSLARALVAILVLGGAADVWAQGRPGEYDVKAAYLYKFAPFVEWPAGLLPSAEAALNLCIVGRDPFGARLDRAVAGQTFGPHPLHVRRLPRIGAGSGCHVVFAGGSKEQSTEDVLKAVAGAPALTITDNNLGATRGMIHFVIRDAKIRFHIDIGAAGQSNLKLSSKLLALGLSVKS